MHKKYSKYICKGRIARKYEIWNHIFIKWLYNFNIYLKKLYENANGLFFRIHLFVRIYKPQKIIFSFLLPKHF